MNFIILEMQTSNGATAVVTPIYCNSDRTESEAVFLEKCAAARRSGLAVHTVILLDNEGKQLAKKTFKA